MPSSSSDHLRNDADRGKGSQEPDERNQAATTPCEASSPTAITILW